MYLFEEPIYFQNPNQYHRYGRPTYGQQKQQQQQQQQLPQEFLRKQSPYGNQFLFGQSQPAVYYQIPNQYFVDIDDDPVDEDEFEEYEQSRINYLRKQQEEKKRQEYLELQRRLQEQRQRKLEEQKREQEYLELQKRQQEQRERHRIQLEKQQREKQQFLEERQRQLKEYLLKQQLQQQKEKESSKWVPKYQIKDGLDGSVSISVELPGFRKEDINVSVNDLTLTLSGTKSDNTFSKEDLPYFEEIEDQEIDSLTNSPIPVRNPWANKKSSLLVKPNQNDSFSLPFELSKNLDLTSITAKHLNGVLTININRKPTQKSFNVNIF